MTETELAVDRFVEKCRHHLDRPDILAIYDELGARRRRKQLQGRIGVGVAAGVLLLGIGLIAFPRPSTSNPATALPVEQSPVATTPADLTSSTTAAPARSSERVAEAAVTATTNDDRSPDTTVMFDSIRQRLANASLAPGVNSIGDVLPDGTNNPKRAELLVVGEPVSVVAGPNFRWLKDDDGAVKRTEVDSDDPAAQVSMYHFTIAVDQVSTGSQAPEELTIATFAIAMDPSLDIEKVAQEFQALETIVVLLDSRSPVVNYAIDVYAVALDGGMLGEVSEGRVNFPSAPAGFVSDTTFVSDLLNG